MNYQKRDEEMKKVEKLLRDYPLEQARQQLGKESRFEAMRTAMATLTQDERDIFKACYIEHTKMDELANRLSYSKSTISHKKNRMLEKFRIVLTD